MLDPLTVEPKFTQAITPAAQQNGWTADIDYSARRPAAIDQYLLPRPGYNTRPARR